MMNSQQGSMAALIPAPCPDVTMEQIADEILLYSARQTRATFLNGSAAVIWGLCDGRRTTAEIIALIRQSYPAADVAGDVHATLEQLREAGLLRLAGA